MIDRASNKRKTILAKFLNFIRVQGTKVMGQRYIYK